MSAEIRFEDHPTVRLDHDPAAPSSSRSWVLGRADDCDLTVRHERVSKRHAEFVRRGGQWFIRDLGSANGVRVGSRRITEETPLDHGDAIAFGSLCATFHDPTPPLPPAPPASASPAAPLTPPATPTRRSTVRATGASRGNRGVGLLVTTVMIFSALFAAVYFVYQHAFVSESDPPIARDDRVQPPDPSAGGKGPSSSGEAKSPPPSIAPTPRDPAKRRNLGRPPRPERESESDPDPIDRRSLTEFGDRNDGVRSIPIRPRPERATTESDPETTVREEAKPENPFMGAETTGDALRLAELLKRYPDHPQADPIRTRLRSTPILIVTWEGGLPGEAARALTARMPLNCGPADRAALESLGASFVECTIAARYSSQYRTGLGRRVGKTRIAPHPKVLELEVRRSSSRGATESLAKLEFKTPRITKSELSPNGLSDSDVWAMTVETKLDRLNRALGKLIRGV